MIEICTRSPIYLFCLFSLFNKHYANAYIVTRKLTSFRYDFKLRVTIRYKLTLICPIQWHSNKTANIMLKSYQFKTHCKGDSHSSKTANNILPGHMTKQRWTPLRLQAKYNILLGVVSTNVMQMNEFEYHFAFRRIRRYGSIILNAVFNVSYRNKRVL